MLEGRYSCFTDRKPTLEKGDSIYYDSIVPHNLTTLAEGNGQSAGRDLHPVLTR